MAPSNGKVIAHTEGSDFDTLLAVYRGGTLSSLLPVASDDDSGQGLSSWLSFRATAGTSYQIALDGYRGASGEVQLFLGLEPDPPPPPNDNFADRGVISGLDHSIFGTSLGATRETGEPNHAAQSVGHSVWWSWTAPTNALLRLDTFGSKFDTTLSVYTGDSVTTLLEVAANNDVDQGACSQLILEVHSGKSYEIAVDGVSGAMGDIQLHLALIPLASPAITRQPQSRLVDAGAVAAFTVEASSLVPSSFRWRRNGVVLTNDSTRIFGAENPQLVLLGVQGRDIGTYSVEVRNPAGSVLSVGAFLRVNTPFSLQIDPAPSPITGEFSCEVGGRVGLNYLVEASSNLVDWLEIGMFPNTNGLIRITDPESVGRPVRFYRATLPAQ